MNKIFNIRSLIVVASIFAMVIIILLLMRSCGKERVVSAEVSSTEIMVGEKLSFADHTAGANEWFWEFGNGDFSEEQSSEYLFPDEGRYQVRLRIDKRLEKLFVVRVKPYVNEGADHIIHIIAPSGAVQGEYLLFEGVGDDKDWRWEFGESGIIDSREKNPIYAFQNHGTFVVRLMTEKTQYPIVHMINIHPKYMESDTTDVMSIAGQEIRVRLQNIADGKAFNANYNSILNTYLGGNPNVLVTVNNNKRNDFYSYCQGLRLTGRNNTTVETVFVESNNPENNYIDHILVLQTDRK